MYESQKFKKMKLRVILAKANTDIKIRFKRRRDIIKNSYSNLINSQYEFLILFWLFFQNLTKYIF